MSDPAANTARLYQQVAANIERAISEGRYHVDTGTEVPERVTRQAPEGAGKA